MSSTGEGIRLQTLWVVSVFGVLLTLVIILATVVVYYEYRNSLEAGPNFIAQPEQFNALVKDQTQRLASFGVVDSEKGVYSIPIEIAMQSVVEEPPSAKGVSSTLIQPEEPVGGTESEAEVTNETAEVAK